MQSHLHLIYSVTNYSLSIATYLSIYLSIVTSVLLIFDPSRFYWHWSLVHLFSADPYDVRSSQYLRNELIAKFISKGPRPFRTKNTFFKLSTTSFTLTLFLAYSNKLLVNYKRFYLFLFRQRSYHLIFQIVQEMMAMRANVD